MMRGNDRLLRALRRMFSRAMAWMVSWVLVVCVGVGVAWGASGFSDVDSSTPHAGDIAWLAERGIARGYGDGSFGGMRDVVRQDMAAFLYRMAGSPAYEPSGEDRARFVDVDSSTPHAREVWWLGHVGIASGWDTPSGRVFGGGRTVVRQDMAAFLYRFAFAYPDRAQVVLDGEDGFRDVDSSTPHAADIGWLARTNVTQGYADGTFGGMRVVVRQDMAAFLHRLAVHEKAYRTDGALREYWSSQGGAAGWIGRPVSQAVASADGATVTQRFQRATLTAGLGGWRMLGSVASRWEAQGGAAGPLGALSYDLVVRVGGGVSFQVFEHGLVVATSDTDAGYTHVLDQDFAAAWVGAFGWDGSNALGRPLTDVNGSVRGGSYVTFSGAAAYRRAGGHRVVPVSGEWLDVYRANGYELGELGYPLAGPESSSRDGGRYQRFENGTIYWSARSGAHAVKGGWFATYRDNGYELGEMGYPTSGVNRSARDNGEYQNFQNGTIYRSDASGMHAVKGAMFARYRESGYEFGIHGFPTSEQYDDNGTPRQNFQRGYMWVGDPHGRYTHDLQWVGQETDYWCVPASTVMAMSKAGVWRSAKGEPLSQSLLANDYFHAQPGIGVWYLNIEAGINGYLGNNFYTSYAFPSADTTRKAVIHSLEIDYPSVVEADERRGGPHLNGHNDATFGHEYAVDGIDTNTNELLLADPGAAGVLWYGTPQKFAVNIDWFLNNFVRQSVSNDGGGLGLTSPRY